MNRIFLSFIFFMLLSGGALAQNATNTTALNSPLSVSSCPDTLSHSVLLTGFVIASVVLIIAGLMLNRILGMMGSFFMLVLSWYIAPCLAIGAYITALFSIFLIIFFALKTG